MPAVLAAQGGKPNPHTPVLPLDRPGIFIRGTIPSFGKHQTARFSCSPVYHCRKHSLQPQPIMQALAIASHVAPSVTFAAKQCAARPMLVPPGAQRRQRSLREPSRPCRAASLDQVSTAPAANQEQDEELALLQTVLAGTELEGAALALAYDAQRDGWSAEAFHYGVDGRGPALVVALTGGQGSCCHQDTCVTRANGSCIAA